MLTVPFTSIEINQVAKFTKNFDATLNTFDKCISNLELEDGKAIKEYLFGDTKIEGKLAIDLSKSYGELWIQGVNCYINCCLKINLIMDEKDLSKDEMLELNITNGVAKYIKIVPLIG